MDVIFHSTADAAGAVMGWDEASVLHALNSAGKKLIAKKEAQQQQRKLLQQATAASAKGDAHPADVDTKSSTTMRADDVGGSRSCGEPLPLKHLLSSTPPHGVDKIAYE